MDLKPIRTPVDELLAEAAWKIIEDVARRHKLPVGELAKNGKGPAVVRARHEAIERLQRFGFGGAAIAGYLGVCPMCVSRHLKRAYVAARRGNGGGN